MAARRSRSDMKMSKCHMWMIGAAFALFLFMWMGAGGSSASAGTIGKYLEGFKEGASKDKKIDVGALMKLAEGIDTDTLTKLANSEDVQKMLKMKE